MLTCHSRKSTGGANYINNGSAQEIIAMQQWYYIHVLLTMSTVSKAYLRLVSLNIIFLWSFVLPVQWTHWLTRILLSVCSCVTQLLWARTRREEYLSWHILDGCFSKILIGLSCRIEVIDEAEYFQVRHKNIKPIKFCVECECNPMAIWQIHLLSWELFI